MVFRAVAISQFIIDELSDSEKLMTLSGKNYFHSGIRSTVLLESKKVDTFVSTHQKGLLPNQIILSAFDLNMAMSMDCFRVDISKAHCFSLKQERPSIPSLFFKNSHTFLLDAICQYKPGLDVDEIDNHALAFSFDKSLSETYLDDISWFIGRGPGSTPSGDDMLIAALCLQYFILGVESPLYKALLKVDLAKKTTPLSNEYYQFALKGLFASPLIQLTRAIARGQDKAIVKRYVNRIKKVGAHSGIDSLYGIYWSIINLYKTLGVK